ncbi:hypothetical protein [Microbacterium sp. ZW T5_56]|uniref:hypothetical protein n=1 Tax=Microbacterium sp. ZW T5_56 TaxID=3378081 RepID=UPI00385237C4
MSTPTLTAEETRSRIRAARAQVHHASLLLQQASAAWSSLVRITSWESPASRGYHDRAQDRLGEAASLVGLTQVHEQQLAWAESQVTDGCAP